jgi:hypothetical protein
LKAVFVVLFIVCVNDIISVSSDCARHYIGEGQQLSL